jgi:hypothetical protein
VSATEHSTNKPVNQAITGIESGMPTMSEPELTAAIEEITARWSGLVTKLNERAGNSPYSQQSILLVKSETPLQRGDKFKLAPLGKSYNGSGNYKDRGRWRKVWAARRALPDDDDNDLLVRCHEDDPGAVRIGCLHLWVQDVESWRKSESVGRNAVSTAFEKLGWV